MEKFLALRDVSAKIPYNKKLQIPDFRLLLNDAPDEVILKYAHPAEGVKKAKRRLTTEMHDLFVQMHDDLATRTTQRTGVSTHAGSESPLGKALLGYFLKFFGITATQHQTQIRGLKRIAKEENLNTGKLNIMPLNPKRYWDLVNTPGGLAVFASLIASAYAGGYLRDSIKDAIMGRPLADPLNPKTIERSLVQNLPFGLLGQIYNSVQYANTPGGIPVDRQIESLKKAASNAFSDDPNKRTIALLDAVPNIVPLSAIILSKGGGISNWLKNEYAGAPGRRDVRRIKKRRKEEVGTLKKRIDDMSDSEFMLKFLGYF